MAVLEPIPGATRIATDVGAMWYPENCAVVTPALAAEGRSEPELLSRLRRCVKPGMTALVAGAHVGYFVRHFAKLVGRTGRVVAVEPAPDNLRLLQANVADAPNVEVIHAAAWASSGTLELALSASNTGDHRAVPGGEEGRERLRVPALALDEVLAGADRVDVVLLDAQASEPHLLWGLHATLVRFLPRLFVELWPGGLREAGHDPDQMLALLTALGYRLGLLDGGAQNLIAAAENGPGGRGTLEAYAPPRTLRRRPSPPRYVRYSERRDHVLSDALREPGVLEAMRDDAPLLNGYGVGLDERIVEIPWACAHLTGGRWLDAGSVFNSRPALTAALATADDLTIVTARPEPDAFTEMGVSYVYGDLRSLPFRDDWFHGVMCLSTLEHVGMDNRIYGDPRPPAADPAAEAKTAFGELQRVLRPGGRLLVTVPFGDPEGFGWFRQFDAGGLIGLVGKHASITVFRYLATGWRRRTLAEAAGSRYRDAGREPSPADGAIAARAVACVRIDG